MYIYTCCKICVAVISDRCMLRRIVVVGDMVVVGMALGIWNGHRLFDTSSIHPDPNPNTTKLTLALTLILNLILTLTLTKGVLEYIQGGTYS